MSDATTPMMPHTVFVSRDYADNELGDRYVDALPQPQVEVTA